MGSFRSSFSRNITYSQAIAAAVSAVENAPPVNAQPQPNPFYSDSELEEIVIIWAKMLFTVLEFLETGDITNLPKPDKRLWAEHLLEQARHVNEIPYDALEDDPDESELAPSLEASSQKSGQPLDDEVASTGTTDTEKIERALKTTKMITIDMHQPGKDGASPADSLPKDPITWREGLLRLRTMFPGAGNFSGFGVGIEAPQDTALFQRLLGMREDLKKIENVQQWRYQQHFLEAQRLKEQKARQEEESKTITTPSGKKVAAFKPRGSPTKKGNPLSDSASVGDMDSNAEEADDQSLHLSRPVGVNIYAGNLKKSLKSKDKK